MFLPHTVQPQLPPTDLPSQKLRRKTRHDLPSQSSTSPFCDCAFTRRFRKRHRWSSSEVQPGCPKDLFPLRLRAKSKVPCAYMSMLTVNIDAAVEEEWLSGPNVWVRPKPISNNFVKLHGLGEGSSAILGPDPRGMCQPSNFMVTWDMLCNDHGNKLRV